MARNKLAKLLLEDTTIETESGAHANSFGIEQIMNVRGYLQNRLARHDVHLADYDPLFEIAKLAARTDDDSLIFKCHSKLADYMYPQIRSLEVQAKQDREVVVKIEIAGYARSTQVETEAEEIDVEGDIDDEGAPNYLEMALEGESKRTKDHD